MKYFRWMLPVILVIAMVPSAAAQQQLIVRDTLGLSGLKLTCMLLNCKVGLNLGDPSNQLFLITVDNSAYSLPVLTALLNSMGVVDVELNQQVSLISATAGPVPESLFDETPLPYFTAPVWNGYATQPAAQIIRVQEAQSTYNITGAGIVAMIDTGVDTQHPALTAVLVPGYNFITNTNSGDETGTLNHSTAAVLDGGEPLPMNSSVIAMLNQAAAAALNQPGNSGFGHGTMTAGVVHLVAPTAQIMPLKAFGSDGTGNLSDIIRAIYYAGQHGSKVISMSFDLTSSSKELAKAIKYVNDKGVICVASAGNDGVDEVVYPAGVAHVMGVASTTDYDTRSTFSSYGTDVWVDAPGEGIVTTYPYGTYAAGWGTSFSAPFVSGTAALLVQVSPGVSQDTASAAIAHAAWIASPGMGNGRLDVYQALDAWLDQIH